MKHILTITEENVLNPRSLTIQDFLGIKACMGMLLFKDIGKRVYVSYSPHSVYQVESKEQRDKREIGKK